MSAGCLEGLSEQKDTASKERQEFNEADQEALYNNTQSAKTEHKKGLGASALLGELPVLGLQRCSRMKRGREDCAAGRSGTMPCLSDCCCSMSWD